MAELWNAAKRGFIGGIKLWLKLFRAFFLWLPCFLFISFPAFVIGYLWCWIVSGFNGGKAAYADERSTPFECWNVVIDVKEQEAKQ